MSLHEFSFYFLLSFFQIGQNPLTTEGAKALISAVMSAPDVEITEIDITVSEFYISLPPRMIIYLFYVFKQ